MLDICSSTAAADDGKVISFANIGPSIGQIKKMLTWWLLWMKNEGMTEVLQCGALMSEPKFMAIHPIVELFLSKPQTSSQSPKSLGFMNICSNPSRVLMHFISFIQFHHNVRESHKSRGYHGHPYKLLTMWYFLRVDQSFGPTDISISMLNYVVSVIELLYYDNTVQSNL